MDGEDDGGSAVGMAGSINLRHPQHSVPDLTGHVHQLPCCIKYNGPCSVSDYFKPKHTGVEIDGVRVEEASFRGRRLQGATVPLPQGYCGFVLSKKNIPGSSQGSLNCWEMKAKFQSITFWNHDTIPLQDDPCLRCFQWFPIAKAMHKQVTEEDLASVRVLEETK